MSRAFNATEAKQLRALLEQASAIRCAIEEIVNSAQDRYDERSEKWQESEAGEEVSSKIDTLRDVTYDLENIESNIETALEA